MQQAEALKTEMAMGTIPGIPKLPCGGTKWLYLASNGQLLQPPHTLKTFHQVPSYRQGLHYMMRGIVSLHISSAATLDSSCRLQLGSKSSRPWMHWTSGSIPW
eukprot:1054041-Amphidinium_carterae.2